MRDADLTRKRFPEYDVDIFEIDSRDYNVEVYCKNLFDNRTKEGWRFISQDTKLLERRNGSYTCLYHFYLERWVELNFWG